MIETINLTKQFRRYEIGNDGNKKHQKKVDFLAVNNISIKANNGEILGILGPNGAGKTTLLRMMGRLMEPTSGCVRVSDKSGNVYTDDVDIKRNIGYLSGNTKLYHRFSCRELLNMVGEIYGLSKEETSDRIDEISEILKLHSFIDNRIENLSTGQNQRANIARTVMHHPDIYILDEPTLGLDIISSQSIIDFMKYEKDNGATVLYSTHYMEEAQYLCDRIIMINKGQVIKSGTPSSIMLDTQTDNLREAFKSLLKMGEDIDE